MEVRFDMKRPCTHCPFRSDETGIRFATQERALDIYLTALIHGFPCHQTADYLDNEDDLDAPSGYVFGEASQHCAGFLIMRLKEDGDYPWPGIGDQDETLERIRQNVDLSTPVFDNMDAFMRANADPDGPPPK